VFWLLLLVSLVIGLIVVAIINSNLTKLPRLHHHQRTRGTASRDPWAKWKDDTQPPREP
jgi:hypothetical protein